jgi:hypothetical protein
MGLENGEPSRTVSIDPHRASPRSGAGLVTPSALLRRSETVRIGSPFSRWRVSPHAEVGRRAPRRPTRTASCRIARLATRGEWGHGWRRASLHGAERPARDVVETDSEGRDRRQSEIGE